MATQTRVAFIALAATIGLGGGVYFGLSRTPGSSDIGTQAPILLYAITLPDLAKRQQPLSQWKNQTLVVNFWAT